MHIEPFLSVGIVAAGTVLSSAGVTAMKVLIYPSRVGEIVSACASPLRGGSEEIVVPDAVEVEFPR